ncbi:MAG: 30S ribosomal protein S20 [Candidatus Izemoplasmataceae bacterium]
MANNKQQKKRNIQNEKRRALHASFNSGLKSAVKLVETHCQNNDLEKAQEALKLANKKLDKSVVKGINHKNYVGRQKSRLALLVNSLQG